MTFDFKNWGTLRYTQNDSKSNLFKILFQFALGVLFCLVLKSIYSNFFSEQIIYNFQPLGFVFGYFSAILILGLLVSLFWIKINKNGLNLVLIGFVANSLEFVIESKVIDYWNLNLEFFGISYFAMNFADFLIIVGWILIFKEFYYEFFWGSQEIKKK